MKRVPPSSETSPQSRTDLALPALLLTPAFAFVLTVAVYPILRIFWLSVFTQNLSTGLHPEFSGLHNYVRVFGDGRFFHTIRTTLLFVAISVTVELLLGLGIALLLNQRFRGRALARVAVLVPWALPTAVLALAWIWIFNDQFGIWNDLLLRAGVIRERVAWLGSGPTALFAVIFADVWKTTPFVVMILLAGLQNIPAELNEAAEIDGASSGQRFVRVTLPLLLPSIALALLFRTLHSFGIFDLIYVMTNGGPGGATETIAIYIYKSYLRYLDFGYGSAMIVVSVAIIGTITAVASWPVSRFLRKYEP